MKFIILISLLFVTTTAHAKTFFGTSLIYTRSSKVKPLNKYEQLISPELSSINFGQTFKLKKYIVKLGTNRLYNKNQKRQLKIDNEFILSKSRLTTDFFVLERLIKTFGLGLLIGNIELKQELYHENNLVEKNKRYAIVLGITASKYLNKHTALSFGYMFHNKEFGFSACILAINYFF